MYKWMGHGRTETVILIQGFLVTSGGEFAAGSSRGYGVITIINKNPCVSQPRVLTTEITKYHSSHLTVFNAMMSLLFSSEKKDMKLFSHSALPDTERCDPFLKQHLPL